MKTTTILKIAIALTIIALIFLVAILLQPKKEKEPLILTEIIVIKDLPPLHFNWTPINERTESPLHN